MSISTIRKGQDISDQEIDWEAVNREWRASGKSQKAFCKKRGLSYNQFTHKRSRLLKAPGVKKGNLVRLPLGGSSRMSVSCYHLHLPSGLRLQVPYDFTEHSLKRLLEILGAVQC